MPTSSKGLTLEMKGNVACHPVPENISKIFLTSPAVVLPKLLACSINGTSNNHKLSLNLGWNLAWTSSLVHAFGRTIHQRRISLLQTRNILICAMCLLLWHTFTISVVPSAPISHSIGRRNYIKSCWMKARRRPSIYLQRRGKLLVSFVAG